ncbi:hypothetical protein CVT24_007702 [Panaeolus cyanescens]|uniref:Uncharacterized protein n=1 Tax=Panaeolus cyanescens TaxID=181874 RepID=A0A409VRE6_9AGAR|nr:hypothetical protein CVT24_007702 [Panaeolus cyanescens]
MASKSPSNSTLLLKNRNPSLRLTPYDGKVGTVIQDHIYTTPNETFIPMPLFGAREVLVRQDFRYGPDDHTLWPQPYSSLSPHLAAIPRKPTDSTHPLAPLWKNPSPSDFVSTAQGAIATGLGKISSSFFDELNSIAVPLQARYDDYVNSLPSRKPNPVAATLHRIVGFVQQRLQSFTTNWIQVRFTVTEFQRLLLELHGCLDYIQTYKPQIDGFVSAPVKTTTLQTIGAFTTNVRVVEEFASVGIPVWFIRPHSSSFDSNVLAEVAPTHYHNTLVMEKHPHYPPVFKGRCDVDSFVVVTHVLQFSRHQLTGPNPFIGDDPSSNRNSEGEPPAKKLKAGYPQKASSASSSAHQTLGRDKFQPLTGPMAPFSIPAWAEQLRNVDQTQPPATERLPKGGYYAYPDPALFLTAQTDKKRQLMIEAYSRIGPVWQSRLQESSGMAMTNQQWRDLLHVTFTLHPDQWIKGETKAAIRQRAVLKELLPAGCGHRTVDKAEMYSLPGTGESFSSGRLPPVDSIRKFAYFLYMLNFQSELSALDQVAREYLDPIALSEHEGEIMHLFPYDTFIVSRVSTANSGLAADSLRDRIPYLRTFARIMSCWKGEKPDIFRLGRHHSGSDANIPVDVAAELEKEIARFYCQQFFNYFRRAAQIPHRLNSPTS